MWSQPERHAPGSITIPCDEIESIEIEGPRNARTVLFLAGLAVDAVIVVTAQPTVAVGTSGCTYQSYSGRAALAQPTMRLTSRAYDTHWGAYVGGESEAPEAQALDGSFLPNLLMMPPAPIPSSAQRNSTTPTPAP